MPPISGRAHAPPRLRAHRVTAARGVACPPARRRGDRGRFLRASDASSRARRSRVCPERAPLADAHASADSDRDGRRATPPPMPAAHDARSSRRGCAPHGLLAVESGWTARSSRAYNAALAPVAIRPADDGQAPRRRPAPPGVRARHSRSRSDGLQYGPSMDRRAGLMRAATHVGDEGWSQSGRQVRCHQGVTRR